MSSYGAIPTMVYKDANAALDFLTSALGLKEHSVFRDNNNNVQHAELSLGKANGAEIVMDIKDEDEGGRGYSCKDPEGYIWNFGSYNPYLDK